MCVDKVHSLNTWNPMWLWIISSVQFSHSVVSDSLWPHGLQHTKLPCPSPTPGACSNSCPLHWWCHPTISSLLLLPQSLPASGSFPMSQFFASTRWSKYWSLSLSFSPSNEYSGLISFRMDWFDLLNFPITQPRVFTPPLRNCFWIEPYSDSVKITMKSESMDSLWHTKDKTDTTLNNLNIHLYIPSCSIIWKVSLLSLIR